LQGVVAGLNIATSAGGGQLNASRSLNIRGTGTIGSGSSVVPLVLIDGMEGDINTVNPQDIENISVLKDASASSIYGSRAAGGVILITTKSGSQGRTNVNYNNNFRFSSALNMPTMADSYTWAVVMNDASIASGNGAWFSDTKLAEIKAAQSDPTMQTMYANSANRWEVWDTTSILPVANTDWLQEHFGKTSFTQEHNVSINGGNDKAQYYFSANYLDQGGILRYGDDNAQRYTINGKISVQLAPWAKFTYGTRFYRKDYEAPSLVGSTGSNVFYHNVCRYWPIVPVTDPNGNYVPESYAGRLEDGGKYKQVTDITAHQFALRLTPFTGFSFNAEANYRVTNTNNHQDYQTVYAYDVDNNPYVDTNSTSSVYEYNYKANYFNPNIYADYGRTFAEKHNFKIMAGFQSEWLRYRSFSVQSTGILSGIPTIDTTTQDNKYISGGSASWATAGFFGRVNYDYDGKYLFEANVRYDGSSRFTQDKRWNWFPSFSAGWNIAEESFWADWKHYVNTLKLRASWGKLGNQNTDNWYPYYSTMGYSASSGTWLVDGTKPTTASQPSLVSSLLTWEKSRTWEIGLDWGALNNRLTGSFGYYQRKTYDMVGPAPELSDVLGASVPKVNNLDMTSKGWDLSISWRDRINDFYYGATLQLSDNRVQIDKYPNDGNTLSKYYAGAYLGDIWGYTTVGIAKTQEEMDAHLATADQSQLGSGWGAGDIMYADLDGDGKVTTGSYTVDDHGDISIIGNSTPRYNFGLNLEAAWKGFDLKIFFQGTLKRDYWASGAPFWGPSVGKWQALVFTNHLDYFRAEDTDSPLGANVDAYYPAANWSGSRNEYTQTRYLQNAAYGRLKNVTIGYTIPQSLTRKAYIENLRVFVSGENLATITSFTDSGDPELIDAYNNSYGFGKCYPLTKTFSFGLSVTF
jgi:TonB-linked SusC/RagA family outer membrane protein